MEPKPKSLLERLAPSLRYAEIASFVAIVTGFALLHLNHGGLGPKFILFGFSALAAVYYFYAYIPNPPSETQLLQTVTESPKGFIQLLPAILRKVLFVASAVALVGILFSILHLAGTGTVILIGLSAITIATIASIYLILRNSESLTILQGALLRAVPIAAYSIHWLYEFWPLPN
jgi:hypothetical protein